MASFNIRVWAALAFAPLAAPALAASPEPVPGEHGMVVTAHRLASEVGVEILKRGGNAVDAAVAVGYALAVVYPTAGNIGGGGFMTLHLADGKSTFLDFRERAPMASTKTMYLDDKGEVVSGLSTDGYLAVGVPGPVMGFELARERYGSMERQELLAPAIRLAAEGFVFGPADVASFSEGNADLAKDPAAAAIFLKEGQPFASGDRLVQADLARSLQQISDMGPDAFYKGPIADAIVAASKAGGGILEKADFERYAVRELEPVECDYRGYTIISSPPPSSGGVIICEILNVLEGYPLGYMGFHSPNPVHAMVEGDAHRLCRPQHQARRPRFRRGAAGRAARRRVCGRDPRRINPFQAGDSAALIPAEFLAEKPETTHFSIIDEAGNAVGVTYTLNGSFGRRVVAAEPASPQQRDGRFHRQARRAQSLRLIQGEANAIEPERRRSPP
jgi:gamma-glutamyltranspeptidase/glutathione hydrolase